jgi:hypothetical protein
MYEFFYDLAVYANENWCKGAFTAREIACHAYTYTEEAKRCTPEYTTAHIQSLIENLEEDVRNGCKEAEDFIEKINEWIDYA